jgi:hypothetical protein
MSWGAQSRSEDAKTPSGLRGRSEKPELPVVARSSHRNKLQTAPVEYVLVYPLQRSLLALAGTRR